MSERVEFGSELQVVTSESRFHSMVAGADCSIERPFLWGGDWIWLALECCKVLNELVNTLGCTCSFARLRSRRRRRRRR